MADIKIAITGGIGSGKSTVADIIRAAGYSVFSCDEINASLLGDKNYIRKLGEAFPQAIEDGRIVKSKLAEIVFADKSALKKLNDLSHSLIMERLIGAMSETSGIVFAEVPLLFEGGFEGAFDYILIVKRDLSERIKSVCVRDSSDSFKVVERISNQCDYEVLYQKERDNKKIIWVENNADQASLKRQVERALSRFQK